MPWLQKQRPMLEKRYQDKVQHIRNVQLTLPFPEDKPEEMKARTSHTIEQWIRWRYPVTLDESSWLPDGIRLSRFVPFTECESCSFACEDHGVDNRFEQPICLKDLRAKEDPQGNKAGSRRTPGQPDGVPTAG